MRKIKYLSILRGYRTVARDQTNLEKFEYHRSFSTVLSYSSVPVVIANSALVTQGSGRKNSKILKSNDTVATPNGERSGCRTGRARQTDVSWAEMSTIGTSPDQVQSLDFFMSRFWSGLGLDKIQISVLKLKNLKKLKIEFGKFKKIEKLKIWKEV